MEGRGSRSCPVTWSGISRVEPSVSALEMKVIKYHVVHSRDARCFPARYIVSNN